MIMSDNQITLTIDDASPELKQVIEFDEVPEGMHDMLVSIHHASMASVQQAWDQLPKSAQNVVDNFEQFHALVTVGQGFAGVQLLEEFDSMPQTQNLSDEQKEASRASMLNDVLERCVKDMVKQVKKARRDPILKSEFVEVFKR
jgi:hypothetical protein